MLHVKWIVIIGKLSKCGKVFADDKIDNKDPLQILGYNLG